MRKIGWFIVGVAWTLLSVLGRLPYCEAQTGSLSGYCVQGATQASVSGLKSTNYLQGVVPSCVVTVYNTGTATKATLYADAIGTSLGNSFTATNKGKWLFYSLSAACYDVVLSGGTAPNAYPSPVTLTAQCSNAPQPANTYNINSIVPYANLGAAILGVDTLIGSGPGIISVNTAGTGLLVSTPTLSAGHDLVFTSSVTADVPIRTASRNRISCSGGAVITSQVASNTGIILVPSGGDQISVRDCSFNAAASSGAAAYILSLDFASNNTGYMTNVSVQNTFGHNVSVLNNFSYGDATHPSTGISVSGTTTVYDIGVGAPDADVKITGCANGVNVIGNHSWYSTYLFEGFGIDAATNPSYATLQSSCLKNFTITANDFHGIITGPSPQGVGLWWGSGLFGVISSGNVADGCGDICYDPEGSAHARISDIARNFNNGAAVVCYSAGYFNSVQGSNFTATGDNPIILIKNNGLDAGTCANDSVIGSVLTATGSNGAAAVHFENTSNFVFDSNKVTDATFDNVGATELGEITNNKFLFTHAIRNGVPLQVPTPYQSEITWSNNDIRTISSQGSLPCLLATPNDSSGGNSYFMDGGHCFGPWAVGLRMGTTTGSNNYNLHGMGLPFTPAAPTYGSYFHGGNYVLNSSATF